MQDLVDVSHLGHTVADRSFPLYDDDLDFSGHAYICMICMICTIQLMSPGGTRKNPRDLYQVVCFYWLNLRCASPTRPRNKRKGMELESRLRTVDADLLKDVNRFKDDVHLRARGFRRKLTLFARFFWYFDRATFGAGGRADWGGARPREGLGKGVRLQSIQSALAVGVTEMCAMVRVRNRTTTGARGSGEDTKQPQHRH